VLDAAAARIAITQEALDYKYLIERPLQYDDDFSPFFFLLQ
jgi:hypothetical protein